MERLREIVQEKGPSVTVASLQPGSGVASGSR